MKILDFLKNSRKNKMRENIEKIIMSNEAYAIRARVVLLSCLLFETNLWILQRFHRFFIVWSCHHPFRKFQFIETKERMDNGQLNMRIHFSTRY